MPEFRDESRLRLSIWHADSGSWIVTSETYPGLLVLGTTLADALAQVESTIGDLTRARSEWEAEYAEKARSA